MATVLRSKLAPILLTAQQRLMDVLRWPEDRVRVFNPHRGRQVDVQAEQYVNLWFGAETPNAPIFDPGGRVDARMYADLHVQLRTRCGLDEQGSDLYWLTDAELGHYEIRIGIYDAICIFLSEDTLRNALTVCPIHLRGTSDYERDPAQPEWGQSESIFTVEYELPILTSYSPLG
jgi:hypothetical protein